MMRDQRLPCRDRPDLFAYAWVEVWKVMLSIFVLNWINFPIHRKPRPAYFEEINIIWKRMVKEASNITKIG